MDRLILARCLLPLLLLLTADAEAGERVERRAARANARGNELMRDGKYDEAVDVYREQALRHPELVTLQANLASALAHSGQGEEALAAYGQALRLSDSDQMKARLLYDLGNTLLAGGQAEQALQSYASALVLTPSDADIKHNIEFALRMMQEGEQEQSEQNQDEQEDNQEDNQQQGDQESQQDQREQDEGEEEGQSEGQQPPRQQEQDGGTEQQEEMDEEEARRLLEAMLEEEKEFQAMRAAQALPQRRDVNEDW